MLFQELVGLVKTIQARIERHFGMYGKLRVSAGYDGEEELDVSRWTHRHPEYLDLYRETGIPLFGASVVLYSPTEKPTSVIALSWRFFLEEEGGKIPEEHWLPLPDRPTVFAHTPITKVEFILNVVNGCVVEADVADLRRRIKEELQGLGQVTMSMEHCWQGGPPLTPWPLHLWS